MSRAQILPGLPKLKMEERHALFQRLNELVAAEIRETPEMLAAIDESLRSPEQKSGISFKIASGSAASIAPDLPE